MCQQRGRPRRTWRPESTAPMMRCRRCACWRSPCFAHHDACEASDRTGVLGVVARVAVRREGVEDPWWIPVEGVEGIELQREPAQPRRLAARSEEHTSELQSLMRISYAVFCLKKKNNKNTRSHSTPISPDHDRHKPPSNKYKQTT